jgi:hypothetical protein
MRFKPNKLWFAGFAALALFGAGCSGINTTQSISPATFFLPGLHFLQADPTPAANPDAPALKEEPVFQIAQAQN